MQPIGTFRRNPLKDQSIVPVEEQELVQGQGQEQAPCISSCGRRTRGFWMVCPSQHQTKSAPPLLRGLQEI